ncbi:MAG TPA: right-handed parallel beta-helix repeat-containing protein, partial [Candidatus Sumerlaeota bacterium]|nr:right-handed parallel beta-helix repeat-containing protein [Candidatus Sumerlaeota bacterium]
MMVFQSSRFFRIPVMSKAHVLRWIACGLFLLTMGISAQAETLFVDGSRDSSGDGKSWSLAFKTIGEALTTATAGTEIWVHVGTYPEAIAMKSGVAVRGGFAGTEMAVADRNGLAGVTLLDAGQAGNGRAANHAVVFQNVTTATLDSFTVTGGVAAGLGTESSGGGVYFSGADASNRLVRCRVSGNRANISGGGVYGAQSSPVFEACQVSGNSAYWGGGACFEGGTPVWTDCGVAGNWGHFGSALYLNNASPVLVHCTVADNAATDQGAAGGALYLNGSSSPRLANTLFQKNDKVAIYLNGVGENPVLSHCLFFNNPDGDYYEEQVGVLKGANVLNLKLTGAVRLLEGDARFVQDSVENSSETWTAAPAYDALTGRTLLSDRNAGWTTGSLVGKLLNPNTAQSQLALVVANTTSTLTVVGNVTGYVPLGASYRFADFHLLNGSAALDRASTETLSQVDFEGDARPGADGLADIGADEAPADFVPAADTVPPVSYALPLTRLQTQPIVKIAWLASDAESGLAGVELFRSKDGGAFVSAGTYMTSPILFDTATAGGDGRYAFYTVAHDQSGNVEPAPSAPDAETGVITSVASQRLYVDLNATGTAVGTDWAHAFRSVSLALEVAAAYTTVTEVWVAGGVYRESIAPRSNLAIFGGFQGTETNLSERPEKDVFSILDASTADAGAAADHVVTLDRVKNVVLDGFTLTGGRANGPLYSGGGVYCNLLFSNAVVIRRCVITGNSAEARTANGGGIFCYSSSPMIQNCQIVGNRADNYGGGVAMQNSSPVLENCVIAANGGYFGGGLYTENSSPVIRNCTIADNTILGEQVNYLGGGLFCAGGAPVIQNTIFVRNAKYAIHEHLASGDPVVTRCLFTDNPQGDYSDYETGVWTGANALNMHVAGVSDSLEGDARFVGDQASATSGTWTAAAVYNAATHRTVLTDSSATLAVGALVGQFIRPDLGQAVQAMVTSNSAVRVEVVGDMTGVASAGKIWRVADYHLANGSAALDRATSSSAPLMDFEGDARPGADGLSDLGADEAPAAYEPPADTQRPVSEALALDPLLTQAAFEVAFLASDAESGLQKVELFYRKDGGAYVSAGTTETSPFRFDTSGLGDGAYDFYTIAYDRAGNAELPPAQPDASTVVVTGVTGTRLYVDRKNVGAQSGMTWEKAYREIGTALRVAARFPSIREIWIAGGVYPESLTVPSNVALYGGFAGGEAVLTERNLEKNPSVVAPVAARGVLLSDVTSVTLDGLVISGGVASGSDTNASGGGIACLNANATNRILNCRILGNTSLAAQGFGGGIYCYRSAPRIENCVIAGNRAAGSGGALGLYSSSPDIVNCTLAANSASQLGGGIYCFSSSPAIWNTLFTRNGQSAVLEANASADPTVRFCLFYDNPNGDYSDYETGLQTGAAAINKKVTGASDNVDGDPSCQVAVAGVWSRIPVYDPGTATTIFTDDSGIFVPGELVGLQVNLKTDQTLEALVTANTTTTLTVVGRVTDAGLFDAYEVVDYRPGYRSAAIDTGTSVSVPVADILNRPRPVDLVGYGREGAGNAFDMGAYEAQALPVKPRPRMKTEPAWTTGTLNTVACYPFVGATSYSLQMSSVPEFATSWTQEVTLKPTNLTHTFNNLVHVWVRLAGFSVTSWVQ